MEGFGVHTSMWTMNWDRAGAERAIAAAVEYEMDFIEIALLNAPAVDAAHSRALLEKHNLRAVCSLGLPEPAWASQRPEAAIEYLKVAIDKTAEIGAEALSGVIFGGIGERTGVPPIVAEYDAALRLSFYACVIAAYTAAVYSPYRVPALASLPIAAILYAQIREPALPTVPEGAVPFLILIPMAVVADGLRRWKRRASTLEREQAEALRRAAEHERARIARELHDVVTHNVSVMVIQAGAARKAMDATPDQARGALLAVEAGGRAAMAELRHVMGLLTMDSKGTDPATDADLSPQPGLDRLEALVQRVRDTGVPVELATSGQPCPMPSGVELTAYRVVQEALTNTVKHAAGAAATVAVDYGADQLKVEVTDTGGVPGASAGTGDGRGLIGLRERLAVYGGMLHAGPRLTGGYRVTATIPLEAQ